MKKKKLRCLSIVTFEVNIKQPVYYQLLLLLIK